VYFVGVLIFKNCDLLAVRQSNANCILNLYGKHFYTTLVL